MFVATGLIMAHTFIEEKFLEPDQILLINLLLLSFIVSCESSCLCKPLERHLIFAADGLWFIIVPRRLYEMSRPPDKSVKLKIIIFISQPKHMLWVLKRTVSVRQFF